MGLCLYMNNGPVAMDCDMANLSGCQRKREIFWKGRKNHHSEHFKGESTYTLCWCIVGVDLGGFLWGGVTKTMFWKLCFKTCVPQVIQIRIVMYLGDVVAIVFRLMSMDLEDSLAPAKIVVDVVRGFEPGTFELVKFWCLKIWLSLQTIKILEMNNYVYRVKWTSLFHSKVRLKFR